MAVTCHHVQVFLSWKPQSSLSQLFQVARIIGMNSASLNSFLSLTTVSLMYSLCLWLKDKLMETIATHQIYLGKDKCFVTVKNRVSYGTAFLIRAVFEMHTCVHVHMYSVTTVKHQMTDRWSLTIPGTWSGCWLWRKAHCNTRPCWAVCLWETAGNTMSHSWNELLKVEEKRQWLPKQSSISGDG
jgi:hypothetical protein